MTTPVIGFAGMTHLGLNSAVAAAERGFDVVCYDPDQLLIGSLRKGDLRITEPDLPHLLAKNGSRVTFRSDSTALSKCDVVYVAPDVATDDNGQSDLSQINRIIEEVTPVLGADAVLVILSQVPPGFARALDLEAERVYYQVETLIFGRALERALRPERFIVGCAEPAVPLPVSYARFLAAFDCPVLPMRYESAELAKISINMCLVASVTVANTLAELCERIGADWSEIVPALKLDRRIGQHAYLAPGLGISGGNLERDLATVINFAERHETDAGVVRAWLANSAHRKDWPWRTLSAQLLNTAPDGRVAVLGLAYKEDTHSTKNSPALVLLAHLADRKVTVYDPVVKASAVGSHAGAAKSALDALSGADAVCLMTPWPEFKSLKASDFAARMRGRLVIDPYGLIDAAAATAAGLSHFTLGVGAAVRMMHADA